VNSDCASIRHRDGSNTEAAAQLFSFAAAAIRPARSVTHSRCPCRLLVPKRKATQEIGRSLRLAARCKECPIVSLQKPNPGLDIAGVALIAINRELGA
jgi:hypothetical protein